MFLLVIHDQYLRLRRWLGMRAAFLTVWYLNRSKLLTRIILACYRFFCGTSEIINCGDDDCSDYSNDSNDSCVDSCDDCDDDCCSDCCDDDNQFTDYHDFISAHAVIKGHLCDLTAVINTYYIADEYLTISTLYRWLARFGFACGEVTLIYGCDDKFVYRVINFDEPLTENRLDYYPVEQFRRPVVAEPIAKPAAEPVTVPQDYTATDDTNYMMQDEDLKSDMTATMEKVRVARQMRNNMHTDMRRSQFVTFAEPRAARVSDPAATFDFGEEMICPDRYRKYDDNALVDMLHKKTTRV